MCSLRCAGLSSARDSADIEVTVGFLMQIDKLVQLIESPVFIRKSAEHLLDFSCRQVSAVVRSFVLPPQICDCNYWSRPSTPSC